MTKARDLANIANGVPNSLITLDANEIPNLDTAKITTGTFADARISSSSVSQHTQSFDDSKIQQDLMVLALQQATDANKAAYSLSNSFVEQFEDSTGIDVQTNTSRNDSEYITSSISTSPAYETGNRTSTYTVTTENFTIVSTIQKSIDGNFSDGNTNSWYFVGNQTITSSFRIIYDLGSGNSKIYTGAKIYQNITTDNGTWIFEGSNDGTTYTALSSNFNWGGVATREVTWNNDTAYRYIRIKGVSGTTSDQPYQNEIEFQTKSITFSSTGNFTSASQTAPATVSKMGIVVLYKNNAGTATLNTDLIAQVSANNGTNYSTVTLTPRGTFSTGINIAVANNVTVTSGTSVKYKISFANQSLNTKETQVHGVGLIY